jgi:hypothetical protein
MPKIPSLAGISLQAAKAGDRVKISYRLNCKGGDSVPNRFMMSRNDLDEFVYPEIIERIEQGKLSPTFRLQRAHIMMYSNESKNKILLNGRTRFRVFIKLKEGVQTGRKIGENEIDDVLGIYPNNSNDLDAAHIMLFKYKGSWLISYDFSYNCAKALKKMEYAKKHISGAEQNLKRGNLKSFIKKLYNATRIIVLCVLVINNSKLSFREPDSKVNELFKSYAQNGNINTKFSIFFSELASLSKKSDANINNYFQKSDSQYFLKLTRELMTYTEEQLRLVQIYRFGSKGVYIDP